MSVDRNGGIGIARKLMDDFAKRTGLIGSEGNAERRYLWTDAFAVKTFFGLSNILNNNTYSDIAEKLINEVHETLGRFRNDDDRKGWISGLPEEKGYKHPTIAGLRIGKKLPERKADESFSDRLEWERDGQYFHYLTRWISALLLAGKETGHQRYTDWAAELALAGKNFIYKNNGSFRMYWKMSIDLSRPLVMSMGAHDPLEGLLLTKKAKIASPDKAEELEPVINAFKNICQGQSWTTTDPLGIGGLLINTVRAAELAISGIELPESVTPEKLFSETMNGLKIYLHSFDPDGMPAFRLAFRECGLSHGLHVCWQHKDQINKEISAISELKQYLSLADQIENFWSKPSNQKADTWNEHLDINAVTLAASLVSKEYQM